nr:MAG TPA: hypothetical protein [Caudoviricetes sp.]
MPLTIQNYYRRNQMSKSVLVIDTPEKMYMLSAIKRCR